MRKRTLYLSELLLRLKTNNDIVLYVPKLMIKWRYTYREKAIKDLEWRPFWNYQVQHYQIENNVLIIVVDK